MADPIVPEPIPTPPSTTVNTLHKVAAWIGFATGVAAVIMWMLSGGTGTPPAIPVIPMQTQMGWVNDPAAVAAVKATLPENTRYFGDTPAGRAVQGAGGTVLLSDAAKKVLGAHLPARNQGQVGCCTSFGSGTAAEYLQLVQIANGEPQEFKVACNEAIYGGARVQIGGGRIRGDGAVTAWCGQWLKDYGLIPREKIGDYNLTTYSETRARQWGQSGCPKPLEANAKQSPIKGISFVRTADEAARAIRQGYPLAVGSMQGFVTTRDSDGFLRPSGQWGHCQAVIGVRDDNRKGFLIVNSWGDDWVKGPTGPFDIPSGSYWVDWNTFDAMTKEGDCIAFSDATGFPARKLDWSFAQANQAPKDFTRR